MIYFFCREIYFFLKNVLYQFVLHFIIFLFLINFTSAPRCNYAIDTDKSNISYKDFFINIDKYIKSEISPSTSERAMRRSALISTASLAARLSLSLMLITYSIKREIQSMNTVSEEQATESDPCLLTPTKQDIIAIYHSS